MRDAQLILDFRDDGYRATRRTLADGLARLEQELETRSRTGRWRLHVPRASSPDPLSVAIWFEAEEGADVVIAYPFSKGSWGITDAGQKIYLTLTELHGAVPLNEYGELFLKDGRVLRSLEFDILPHPKDFTDLEHAIVGLTVRYLQAEEIAFRYIPEVGWWWIDYNRLYELRVRNVKELGLYINTRIGTLPRNSGKPSFGPVSVDKIQTTLSLAGIRKARGRKPKTVEQNPSTILP